MNKTSVALGLALAGTVALLAWKRNRIAVLAASSFYRPDLVEDIASQLPQERDAFILAAWNYVANTYPYEGLDSKMSFDNGMIECIGCYLPSDTLEREVGNCVAKSSLLASILVTRLPANTVHIIIGSYSGSFRTGGHSWVEVYRDNAWYLLETTKAPNMRNPWVLADLSFPLYDPGVLITSDGMSVEDPQYAAAHANCNCGQGQVTQ